MSTESQWKPIESAPRDGTTILGYWAPAVEMGSSAIDVTCWLGRWTDPDDVEAHYNDPTHWMPLPAPPQ